MVTYNARLEVANDELLLRPGMTATVAVVTKQAKGVLTVPSSAFRYRPTAASRDRGFSLLSMFTGRMGRGGRQRGGDQPQKPADGSRMLYVLKDGRPHAVSVRIGATDGELTEIISGLAEGDRVITASQQRG